MIIFNYINNYNKQMILNSNLTLNKKVIFQTHPPPLILKM